MEIGKIVLGAALCASASVESFAGEGPCDIYARAKTPCVAAHSLTRALFSTYNGNLYQVRRADNTTKDIPVEKMGGYVNASVQDEFCAGTTCTISVIYDQSSYENHLVKSPKVFWLKDGGVEAVANKAPIYINGRKAYGFYRDAWSKAGYRNNNTRGVATGDEAESMYMVVDGKHYNNQCCFNYGNAETTGNDDGPGTMECIYFGDDTDWGGPGLGKGPWVAADLEDGVFKGSDAGYLYGKTHTTPWPNAYTIDANYVTAMLKGPNDGTFALKGGDAQKDSLTTMWDGPRKKGYSPRKLQGAIVLGNGGDGSDGGAGTFFEGVMTIGNPPDSIDNLVQKNIAAAGYGSKVRMDDTVAIAPFKDTLSIPGKIEAEDYDKGENGRGFLDTDVEHENSIYRADNAGLDSANGAVVYGYVTKGDWLRYTVNVTSAESLEVSARVGSAGDNGAFSILIDDKSVASITVPNTGDWNAYETVKASVGVLTKGPHVLKISMDNPYFNLDWIEFSEVKKQDDNSLRLVQPVIKTGRQMYSVFDVQGNAIATFKANDFHSGWNKIQANLPVGMYIVKDQVKTFQMIKTK